METLRRIALVLCLVPLGAAAQGASAAASANAPVVASASAETPVPAQPTPSGKAAQSARSSQSGKAAPAKRAVTGTASAKTKSTAKSTRKRTSRSQSAKTPVTAPAPVDLSLPKDMVKNLKPDVGSTPAVRTSLLPAMFPDNPSSDSNFQLNGRLISNEMQLQLRNDSRRDLEGAAIEFQFKQ